jgi:hypothetical protein
MALSVETPVSAALLVSPALRLELTPDWAALLPVEVSAPVVAPMGLLALA